MIYVLYLIIVILLGVFLYFRWQYAMLFHPRLYREKAFDERFGFLSVTADDGIKLEGCIYEPGEYKATLLYFGGRGQDSVGLLPKLVECYGDFRIVTFNYRGYGKSEGTPNEENILSDALLVYEKVTKNFGQVDILAFSFGCTVASYVASKKYPKKLFLIAPFASLKSLVQDIYGFAFPLLRFHFDTCSYLKRTKSQTKIFISKDDDIVSYKNTKRLYDCLVEGSIVELEKLTHVELLCDVRVSRHISDSF